MQKHKTQLHVKNVMLSTRLSQLQASLGAAPLISRPEKITCMPDERGRALTASPQDSTSPSRARSLSLSLSPLPSPRQEGNAEQASFANMQVQPLSPGLESKSKPRQGSADLESRRSTALESKSKVLAESSTPHESASTGQAPKHRRGANAGTLEIAAATATASVVPLRQTDDPESSRLRQKLLCAEAEVRDAKWKQYCAEKKCRQIRSRWRACDRLHAIALRRQKALEKSLEAAVCQVERRAELVEKVDKDRRQNQDMRNKTRELGQERIDSLQKQLEETMRMLRSERVLRQEEQADINMERAAFRAEQEEAMRTEAKLRAEVSLLKQTRMNQEEQLAALEARQDNVDREDVNGSPLKHATAVHLDVANVGVDVVDAVNVVVEKPEHDGKKTAVIDVVDVVVVENPEEDSKQAHEKLSPTKVNLSSRNGQASPGSPSRASSQTRRKSSQTHQGLRGSRSVERPSGSRSPGGQRGLQSLEAHLEERRRQRREKEEASPERSKSLSDINTLMGTPGT